MYPTPHADRLLLCGVQTLGGVPAVASPVVGRHTTPLLALSPFRTARDPSPMSFSESESVHSGPLHVRDRPLWNTARHLMTQHLPAPSGDRCVNPGCAAGYPCTLARTATRLAAASTAPFHQRMTALLDAGSCEPAAPAYIGLVPATELPGTDQADTRPNRTDLGRASSVDLTRVVGE